jgi:hypothetical protein
LPPGSQALPAGVGLYWDFMPMIIDGASRNLFYWNGLGADGQPGTEAADVSFGPPPASAYTLSLFDKNGASGKYWADGTNTIRAGGNINETDASDGHLHEHRFFFLEDNDGNSGTPPAAGIYLIAQRFRMAGLLNSDPVFIVFATSGASLVTPLDDAAVPWVQQHVAMLTGVPGDFNRSGQVEAADYVLWRQTLGATGSTQMADWNYNNQVDAGDYDVWRSHFGQVLPSASAAGAGQMHFPGSTSLPEPSGAVILISTVVWLAALRRR